MGPVDFSARPAAALSNCPMRDCIHSEDIVLYMYSPAYSCRDFDIEACECMLFRKLPFTMDDDQRSTNSIKLVRAVATSWPSVVALYLCAHII